MRLHTSCLTLLGLLDLSSAWTLVQPHHVTSMKQQRSRSALSLTPINDIHEFDHLLHETDVSQSSLAQTTKGKFTRRVIQLGGDDRSIVLTSAAVSEDLQSAVDLDLEGESAGGDGYDDPYADIDYTQQMGKIQAVREPSQGLSLEDRFKSMDLQDICMTLILPAIVGGAGLRWGFRKASTRVAGNADQTLDSFAAEMIFHDGNEDEMRMCYAEYGKKLMWMGPKKSDAMIKRYLQSYAKKKTVSPKSIRTLSYVFALFKLSEDRAAEVLVSLCKAMGTDNLSSAGKILFFGSRILKSPEGVQGLTPIRTMIKSTYRDENVAETLVETSQQAIGEAAFRATVLAGGKKQKKLAPGWEVLGLDKETATRIFEEEAKEGFLSQREIMYGGQTRKYDKKGNRIKDEKTGELEDPENAIPDEEEAQPASNVYECGSCGFTLFIAKGREFKFYGDDFNCPECGAKKEDFQPKTIEE